MSKRDDIIKGTIELVAKNGISNTPTIKIAKHSGAAEYTLFRLFGSKDELLHETYSELTQKFRQVCEKEITNTGTYEKKFKNFLKLIVKYYREHHDDLSFMQQYVNAPIGAEKRPDIRCENGEDISQYPMIHLLAQGRAQGILKQLPMTALASITHQSIIAVLGEEQTRKIKRSQEIMDLLIEACWQGVKA